MAGGLEASQAGLVPVDAVEGELALARLLNEPAWFISPESPGAALYYDGLDAACCLMDVEDAGALDTSLLDVGPSFRSLAALLENSADAISWSLEGDGLGALSAFLEASSQDASWIVRPDLEQLSTFFDRDSRER